jgi:hypothetical protein
MAGAIHTESGGADQAESYCFRTTPQRVDSLTTFVTRVVSELLKGGV